MGPDCFLKWVFASLVVSRKYEEISPPHVEDFCYITDNTYTKEEVCPYPIISISTSSLS